jgi:hypothetical protein
MPKVTTPRAPITICVFDAMRVLLYWSIKWVSRYDVAVEPCNFDVDVYCNSCAVERVSWALAHKPCLVVCHDFECHDYSVLDSAGLRQLVGNGCRQMVPWGFWHTFFDVV